MYFSEISPASLRGALGSVHQLSIVLAIWFSQIFGLPYILGNDWGWPILLGISAAPAVFQAFALLLCPESPTYLYVEKRSESAARNGTVKPLSFSRMKETDKVCSMFIYSFGEA